MENGEDTASLLSFVAKYKLQNLLRREVSAKCASEGKAFSESNSSVAKLEHKMGSQD